MSTHNIPVCFCGEIREISELFARKCVISKAMFIFNTYILDDSLSDLVLLSLQSLGS